MEIVEGKFYKTRGGRKAVVYSVGPTLARYNADGEADVVFAATGRASVVRDKETHADLIAEWQDEPEKEISDMSEVKFKVGDVVRWKLTELDNSWQNFEIKEIDEENELYLGDDIVSGSGAFCFHWDIELVNKNIPEPNTKWIFNDGQDFVVRVVGFNDKGQIVLETVLDKHGYDLGNYFTFENEPEKFGEFYKPWVEKVEEPNHLVGYVRVVKSKINGRLDFDVDLSDTEQEARDGFDDWDGAWELVDVVKVEWEQP